jgi:hypothetical protein
MKKLEASQSKHQETIASQEIGRLLWNRGGAGEGNSGFVIRILVALLPPGLR